MPRPKLTPEERQARKLASQQRYREANRARLNADSKSRHEADPSKAHARYLARRARMTDEDLAAFRTRQMLYMREVRTLDPDKNRREALAYYYAKKAEDPTFFTEKQRAFVEANPTYHTDYRAEHPDIYKTATRNWLQAHPQANATYAARRRARLKNAARNDVTEAQRVLVLTIAKGRCAYCPHYKPDCTLCPKGRHKGLTVDHITPVEGRGDNTLQNLVACCKWCNSKKRTKPNPIPVQPLLL